MSGLVHPAVSLTGTIVFGVATTIYLLLTATGKQAGYSSSLRLGGILTFFTLTVSYWLLYEEQGFYNNGASVVWWPRYVAEALSLSLFVHTLTTFLWCKKTIIVFASAAAFLLWIVVGLIPAVLPAGNLNWFLYAFGVVVCKFVLCSCVFKFRRRNDNIAYWVSITVKILLLAILVFLAFTTIYADLVSLEITEGVFLIFDGTFYFLGLLSLLALHIPHKNALKRKAHANLYH